MCFQSDESWTLFREMTDKLVTFEGSRPSAFRQLTGKGGVPI